MNLETAIEAYALAAFTRILQMDVEEATDICKGAWKAVNNKNTHMYMYQ